MQPTPIAAAAATLASDVGDGVKVDADLMAPMSDEALEAAAPSVGPKLTMDQIQAVIKDEIYTRIEGTNVTVCTLVLQNGFTAVGVNEGPVSAVNFNQELGCEYAYKKALGTVWTVEGYLLAERLYREKQGDTDTKDAAIQVFKVLRLVQDEVRKYMAGEGTAMERMSDIHNLLVDPLSVPVA